MPAIPLPGQHSFGLLPLLTFNGSIAIPPPPSVPTGLLGGSATTTSGTGGPATLTASTFPIGGLATAMNGAVSLIKGGNGGSDPCAFGGDAIVTAIGMVGSAATNSAGALMLGGDGCPPGVPFLFGTPTFAFGAMAIGFEFCPAGAMGGDPPEGMFAGDATMIGASAEIAAGNLMTIGSLTNFPAFDLSGDLTITLAPGGILDLTGLSLGQIIVGGDANIQADTVLLPGILTLADLIAVGGTINKSIGGRYARLSAIPDLHITLSPGQTLELPVYVANIGNMPEDMNYSVSDSNGWITPISGSGTYDPMNGKDLLLTINVPPTAVPGTVDSITISGETQDLVASITSTITITVAGSAAPTAPQYTFPQNEADDIGPNPVLSWNSGTGATSHDVYFGTVSPPPLVQTQPLAMTTFTPPGPLLLGTKCYWMIRENGNVSGGIWEFTVGYKCDPPLVGDTDRNCVLDMYDIANVAAGWLNCTQTPSDFCP